MNKAQSRNHAFWYRLILKLSDESDGYIPLREDLSRRNDLMEEIKGVILDNDTFTDQLEEILILIKNYDCVSDDMISIYFPDV